MISEGNHVKFVHFVLLAISELKKQKHDLLLWPFFFVFRSVYNKTVIRFGFCDIQNIQAQNLSSDNEFHLHEKKKRFSYQWLHP